MKATFINLAASLSGDRQSHLCKDIFEGLSFMQHKSTFSIHWQKIGTNIPCLQAFSFEGQNWTKCKSGTAIRKYQIREYKSMHHHLSHV